MGCEFGIGPPHSTPSPPTLASLRDSTEKTTTKALAEDLVSFEFNSVLRLVPRWLRYILVTYEWR